MGDTGKAYYGSTNLYFMRADGMEYATVASGSDGAVHAVEWSPMQDEFLLLHGDLPCRMNLHDGKKATQKMEFGTGHRNTIRWNTFGRLLLGGFGQLAGDVDFWDKTGKKKLGSLRMECIVVSAWAPDGRHLMGATTAPRMRVDNKIEIYDYCGNRQGVIPFEELNLASWRPLPRGKFQDRPPSPGRQAPSASSAKAAGGKPAAKHAYRPPGARSAGGGGLSSLLRQELGSTSADSSSTANKVGASRVQQTLPPVMAPPTEDDKGGGNSRNARRKKAKESAAASAEEEHKAKLEAALSNKDFSPPVRKVEAEPAPADKEPQRATASASNEGAADNPEVEKKVRALRKKIRDIEKLEEKPAKDLDVLQKEKIKGKADLLKHMRDLGVEE